jgi:hypothetical protein
VIWRRVIWLKYADISEERAAPCLHFCPEDGDNRFQRNVDNALLDYMESHILEDASLRT